jgi:hypothetical protein
MVIMVIEVTITPASLDPEDLWLKKEGRLDSRTAG